MIFFNFFNFFNFVAIFLEFSITSRVGTEWNDNFYFLSFSAFPQSISAWKDAIMVFFNFLNFLLFFWNFLFLVRHERNRTLILFSLFLSLFHPTLAWNEALIVFFNFLNFFAIFLEFSITRRVETKRNYNFYFLSFSTFSNLFLLGMKP